MKKYRTDNKSEITECEIIEETPDSITFLNKDGVRISEPRSSGSHS